MFVNTVAKRIMWGDLDSLGIVFYPRFYEWIDASGHLFFEALGMNLGEMWHHRGMTFGLVSTSSDYTASGRYHQGIEIKTSVEAVGGKTVTLSHRIVDAATGDLMVDGREVRICLDVSDLGNFRAREIPPDVRAKLEEAAG